MKKYFATAATALAFVGISTGAFAALVTIDFSGIASGSNSNLFGSAVFHGDPFEAVFVFDTSTVGARFTSNSTITQISGGTGVLPPGAVDPLVSASFTVNGNTAAISGAYSAIYNGSSDGTGSSIFVSVSPDGLQFLQLFIGSQGTLLPNSVTTPFSYTVMAGDGVGTPFRIRREQSILVVQT
jgi:hypothetical protein